MTFLTAMSATTWISAPFMPAFWKGGSRLRARQFLAGNSSPCCVPEPVYPDTKDCLWHFSPPISIVEWTICRNESRNPSGARRLFGDGASVLVAVSGGLDSMVLLCLLARLAPVRGWRLAVAHFQPPASRRSSDADERFVGERRKKLGLPFIAGGGKVQAHASACRASIVMAARELRHDFLARTARARAPRQCIGAIHADDQVELFSRSLRGAAYGGLTGMKWRNASPADPESDAWCGRCWRSRNPFL